VVGALDDVMPIALALLRVVCDSAEVLHALERYNSEWRHVEPSLNGHDLEKLGLRRGVIYRTVLADLRAGRLDGTIHTREDEVAIVRRLAGAAG
jgi:tRNA nucleotidyltransferase (CCA-adding enzyme)